MVPCILCDIDGTLADLRHRLHFVSHGARNWDGFFAAAHLDTPIDGVRRLIQIVDRHGYEALEGPAVILASGRPERLRKVTETWLVENGIGFDGLYMRPDGDTRPDHVVKAEILVQIRADGHEPFLAIDDRPSIIEVWRAAGICTLQVWAPGSTDVEVLAPTATLTVMVGPSGAGKSTWLTGSEAHDLGIRASHILASDDIRADLTGGISDQSRNHEVFEAQHAVAKARLKCGLPVVLDATHLHRKDRLSAVALVPTAHPVRYVIVNRNLEAKRTTGGWRNTLVGATGEPFNLLGKHEHAFQQQLANILKGDERPNVSVFDRRVA